MIRDGERVNRVVTIEQVLHGFVVVITPITNEAFFNDLDEVLSYLKFYFNGKEAEG